MLRVFLWLVDSGLCMLARRSRLVLLCCSFLLLLVPAATLAAAPVWLDADAVEASSAPVQVETRDVFSTRVAALQEPLSYSCMWSDPPAAQVRLQVMAPGMTAVWSSGEQNPEGIYLWDTSELADGPYELTLQYLDAAGELLGELNSSLHVAVTIAVHGGVLAASEQWAAAKVHVVRELVVVPAGITLRIEPGAVVKFESGAGIDVFAGGEFIALGGTFTHIADDLIGGDTNQDGIESVPDLDLYQIGGAGVLTMDATTALHYRTERVSGMINGDVTWLPGRLYCVENDLVLSSGSTLTILAGTIVRFRSGCSLTVLDGAELRALGSRAQPIVFTSWNDDSHGGDIDGLDLAPQPGDWDYIKVHGTATFRHAQLLYAASRNEQGIVQARIGGVVNLESCLIAHAKYDGLWTWGGSINVSNSVISDVGNACASYAGQLQVTNCVFYDFSHLAMYWGGWEGTARFSNCIFDKDLQGVWLDTGDSDKYLSALSFDHCLFWLIDARMGEPWMTVGENGNIWADPLFTDAVAGDFSLQGGSPCIDAGDGNVAPEKDAFGQPRMDVRKVVDTGVAMPDGVSPDIGIYEFPGISSGPVADLCVEAISAAESAMVGGTLTVSYTVTNVGKVAAVGLMRDSLALVGDVQQGGEVVLVGDCLQNLHLNPGESCVLAATMNVPPLRSGLWYAEVTVNSQTLLYERNRANNRAQAGGKTHVFLPELGIDGETLVVPPGGTLAYSLAVATGTPVALLVSAPADASLRLYGALGRIPSAERCDAQGLLLADGRMLLFLPPGGLVSKQYVSFENVGAAPVSMQVQVLADPLAVFEQSTSRLLNRGVVTVVLTGAGLTQDLDVFLEKDGQSWPAELSTVNAAQLACAFTVTGMAPGHYDLVLRRGTETLIRPAAIELFSDGTGPILKAWLELPSAVRDGRLSTAYVCYRNEGDADLRMPVFEVICPDDLSLHVTFYADAAGMLRRKSLRVVGISNDGLAGVLPPGYEGRVPFFFRAWEQYRIVLNEILAGEEAPPSGLFSSWDDYFNAMATAATRLNRRGRPVWLLDEIERFEHWRRRGQPVSAISGHLFHAVSKEALAGYMIRFRDENGVVVAETTTSADGYFQVAELVADVEYTWSAQHAIPKNGVSLFSRPNDTNGVVLLATPLGAVRGVVVAAGTDEPLEGMTVLASGDGLPQYQAQTDALGRYVIPGMIDGLYDVSVLSANAYVGALRVGVAVSSAKRWVEAPFSLSQGGRLSGQLLGEDAPLSHAVLRATRLLDAAEFVAVTDAAGEFCFDGLAAGTYAFAVRGGVWQVPAAETVTIAVGDDLRHDFTAYRAPIFYALPAGGVAPLSTSYCVNDLDLLETAQSWSWDFNGDGVEDSTEATPSYTYNDVGTYTVSLRVITATGEELHSVGVDMIMVDEPIPTVIKGNVVVVDEASEYAYVAHDADTLSLRARVDQPTAVLAVGTIVVGLTPEQTAGFVRRVVAVNETDGLYELTTVEAGFDEVFESMSVSMVLRLTEEDLLAMGATREAGVNTKVSKGVSFALSSEVSMDMSTDFLPSFDFDMRKRPDGSFYLRCVSVNTFKLRENASFEVSGGIAKELSKDVWTWRKSRVVMAGWVPIVITPEMVLTLGGCAGIEGKIKVGTQQFSAMRTNRAGLLYDHGFRPVLESTTTTESDIDDIEFDLSGELRGFIRLTASVWLYGFARITSNGEPYVALQFDPGKYEVRAVAGIKVGTAANLIDLDLFKRVLNLDDIPDFELGVSKKEDFNTTVHTWKGPRPDFEVIGAGEEAKAGTPISFINKSSEGDFGSIERYHWDFGDGTTSAETNPQHAYALEGVYRAHLTVFGTMVSITTPCSKLVAVGKKPPEEEEEECPEPEWNGDDDGGGDGDEHKETKKRPRRKKKDDRRNETVVSFDPNEMAGPLGLGDPNTQRLVTPGQWLDYIVYFENLATATAAAQEVSVAVALSEYLDWSSLELGEISFNQQTETGLLGRHAGALTVAQQASPYQVKIAFALDAGTGVARWYLRSFDPTTADGWPAEPTAGFLPPNDDSHRGEGQVSYRVKVRDDAPAGARITAAAEIIFDQNPMIPTDPSWWNTIALPCRVTLSGVAGLDDLTLVSGAPYGPLPEPAQRESEDFAGWWTEPDGAGSRIAPESVVPDGGATLYPHWRLRALGVVTRMLAGNAVALSVSPAPRVTQWSYTERLPWGMTPTGLTGPNAVWDASTSTIGWHGAESAILGYDAPWADGAYLLSGRAVFDGEVVAVNGPTVLQLLAQGADSGLAHASAGYFAGGRCVVLCRIAAQVVPTPLRLDVTLPDGWSYVRAEGAVTSATSAPEPGEQGTLSWQWPEGLDDALLFSYELAVPYWHKTAQDIRAAVLTGGIGRRIEQPALQVQGLHDVALARGWSLLSLPCAADTEVFASLVGDNGLSSWFWNGLRRCYSRLLAAPAAGQGFWLHSEEALHLMLPGSQPTAVTMPLGTGWHLVGPADEWGDPALPNYAWNDGIFTLDSAKGVYRRLYGPPLHFGKGYWLFLQ